MLLAQTGESCLSAPQGVVHRTTDNMRRRNRGQVEQCALGQRHAESIDRSKPRAPVGRDPVQLDIRGRASARCGYLDGSLLEAVKAVQDCGGAVRYEASFADAELCGHQPASPRVGIGRHSIHALIYPNPCPAREPAGNGAGQHAELERFGSREDPVSRAGVFFAEAIRAGHASIETLCQPTECDLAHTSPRKVRSSDFSRSRPQQVGVRRCRVGAVDGGGGAAAIWAVGAGRDRRRVGDLAGVRHSRFATGPRRRCGRRGSFRGRQVRRLVSDVWPGREGAGPCDRSSAQRLHGCDEDSGPPVCSRAARSSLPN